MSPSLAEVADVDELSSCSVVLGAVDGTVGVVVVVLVVVVDSVVLVVVDVLKEDPTAVKKCV